MQDRFVFDSEKKQFFDTEKKEFVKNSFVADYVDVTLLLAINEIRKSKDLIYKVDEGFKNEEYIFSNVLDGLSTLRFCIQKGK